MAAEEVYFGSPMDEDAGSDLAEDCGCEEKMPEMAGGPGVFSRRKKMDYSISYSRRLQLNELAKKIAAEVLESTKPHERCLLRRMVEHLMPGMD